MRYLALLLLAGCVHTPQRLTVVDPEGKPLATVDMKTGEVKLTTHAMKIIRR